MIMKINPKPKLMFTLDEKEKKIDKELGDSITLIIEALMFYANTDNYYVEDDVDTPAIAKDGGDKAWDCLFKLGLKLP